MIESAFFFINFSAYCNHELIRLYVSELEQNDVDYLPLFVSERKR